MQRALCLDELLSGADTALQSASQLPLDPPHADLITTKQVKTWLFAYEISTAQNRAFVQGTKSEDVKQIKIS